MSWLRPANRSDNVCFPFGPSKTYSFLTFSQGNSRRRRLSSSRRWVNSLSLRRSSFLAVSHSAGSTTERFTLLAFVTGFVMGGLVVAILVSPLRWVDRFFAMEMSLGANHSHDERAQAA